MSKNTRKIKIEYAGGPARNANITDAETGETIEGIQRCYLTLDALDYPRAELYVSEPALSIKMEADVYGQSCRWEVCGDKANQFAADLRDLLATIDQSVHPELSSQIGRLTQIVRFFGG